MQEFKRIYHEKLIGAIHGWDRIRFRGTIRWLASERGLRTFLGSTGILLKDFGRWTQAITQSLRAACAQQAEKLGIPLMYLRSSAVNKEAQARRIADQRGVREGDICMFSVVEPCIAPQVSGNRQTQQLELHMRPRKCVWIYHYWIDPQLGFGHTRLQTWLPWTATVCVNGRHWLERQLLNEKIDYCKDGNCFRWIADPQRAQELCDDQLRTDWPAMLDRLLRRNCPVVGHGHNLELQYYWSADETEWATDVMFRSPRELDALFPALLRHGLVIAQSPTVLRFFGRTVNNGRFRGRAPDEVITDLRQRYEGFRLKHWINRNSIKMYNKAGNLLRVETTINSTRDFKVFRRPDDDRSKPASWQKMRKGVSDLHRRAQVSQACNDRYLDSLASARVCQTLQQTVGEICCPVIHKGRRHRALNPLQPQDLKLLQFITRGEMQLNGFRNRDLRGGLYGQTAETDPDRRRRNSACTTRRLALLRAHRLIKKVPRTHRYILTAKGRKVTCAILAAASADIQQLMEIAA